MPPWGVALVLFSTVALIVFVLAAVVLGIGSTLRRPVPADGPSLADSAEPLLRSRRGLGRFDARFDRFAEGTQLGLDLVDGIVPLAGDLATRLAAGTRVADIGCGTGHTTNLLAQAFPASTFVGYDLAVDALERGRAEASALGVTNATFEVVDVASLPRDPALGAAFAFDAIHDQADPVAVLASIYEALEPGGTFVMFDIRASSHLEHNVANPMAPLLYAISTLHCMTVSLASDGAGLGTVWGEELALEMLTAAGFVEVEVHEAPADPMDSVYVAHKPA
jgi:SAM-dependent methyltransferase